MITLSLLLLWSLAAYPASPARANRNLPTDLSYNTETTWLLPGLPDLSAASGFIPHNFSHGEAVFEIGNEIIRGFRPGKVYPEMYVRDIAWGMETAQYYYPDEYLREPIEAYLHRQYTANTISLDGDFGVVAGAGSIGGILTPSGQSNKQTITTDEETSLIHAAFLYYRMTYNSSWLEQSINGLPIIDRLNLAADWLYQKRLDPELQLFWRGHTTDWGDVKFEKGPGYTDYNPAQDHLTASIYDQALAHMALLELAEMNAAVGDTDQADAWQEKAETLKSQTNAVLWQPEKGFYLTHAHVTLLVHDFDESAMVSISNALAVYAGLADFEQSKAIFRNLEEARVAAGVSKPGLALYPFYPNQWPDLFFDYPGMGYGNYQNGGVWDWWGGVQIKAEFLHGFSETAQKHLFQVANDWRKHPGNIIEWQSSIDPRHEGSHYYSAAAGTMGSAIIEGFFGLTLAGNGLTIQPRLGLNDGYVRVYQAATDRYAAYTYDWNQTVTRLDYGTNAKGAVTIKVLKLRSEQIGQVTVDGKPVDFETEAIGYDTYTIFDAPTGQHTVEIIKGSSPSANAPIEAATSIEVEDKAEGSSRLARPSTPIVAPNLRSPAQVLSTAEEQATPTNHDDQLSATTRTTIERDLESRFPLLQLLSALLGIIICLTLIFLAIVRRLVGLNFSGSLQKQKPTVPRQRPSGINE